MPKRFTPQQCMMPKVQNFRDILDLESAVEAADVPALEYGYVQIDDYRSKKRVKDSAASPLKKRYVPLPKGTFVRTYSEECVAETPRGKVRIEPLRSYLRQFPYCSQATAAEGG